MISEITINTTTYSIRMSIRNIKSSEFFTCEYLQLSYFTCLHIFEFVHPFCMSLKFCFCVSNLTKNMSDTLENLYFCTYIPTIFSRIQTVPSGLCYCCDLHLNLTGSKHLCIYLYYKRPQNCQRT